MKINLNKIPTNGLKINENIVLDKSLYEHANILEIKDLNIKGLINYDYENNLVIDLNIEGKFVLSDTITLEPIDYSFTSQVDEKIADLEETCGKFYEKSKNILDISEILWENIVLEVPMRITKGDSSKISLKGEGWELKNENEKKIDPRLAKLTELLEKGKE